MTKANGQQGEDALVTQFGELREYIESSHDALGNRIGKVETRLTGVEGRQASLERTVDSGFDRVERKLDALARAFAGAKASPYRRRKP